VTRKRSEDRPEDFRESGYQPAEASPPPPESPFEGVPAEGGVPEGMHPDDLPPRQQSLPAPKSSPASADRPGEEEAGARFLASRGVPVRPEHASEKPATTETGPSYPGMARVADPSLPLPRVCDQSERAYEGTCRYKVRAEQPGNPFPPLYVLTEDGDEEGAKRCYAERQLLHRRRKVVDDQGNIKEVSPVYDIIIVKLPD
jgi:hypothetical protein